MQWILTILKAGQSKNWALLPFQYIKGLDEQFDIELFALEYHQRYQYDELSRVL